MGNDIFEIYEGNSPLIATAIHDGHKIRNEISSNMSLSDSQRLQEEDPFTAILTTFADTRIIVKKSRFEVDINRPREKAVYINPEDAWNLHVWKTPPNQGMIDKSLAEYDEFYKHAHQLFTKTANKFGGFIVFDLHSYNHRRDGENAMPADLSLNPEINIGTGTMDRQFWAKIVDRFITDLKSYNFLGRQLDVRENIKFKGGFMSRWIHENFPRKGCSISIEFKKFFMNEWTGELFQKEFDELKLAMASTVKGMLEEFDVYVKTGML